jgi:hypothetical protein
MFFSGGKAPPYSTDVKNEWSYTPSPPICLHGVDRNTFTVTITNQFVSAM